MNSFPDHIPPGEPWKAAAFHSPPSGPVVIWGAGGHASVVADILCQSGTSLAGFIDDMDPNRRGESFCGHLVLGDGAALEDLLSRGITHCIVAFGDNARRLKTGALVQAKGMELVRALHPSAVLAPSAELGAGAVMVAGSVVNPFARIGHSAIINTCASVGHHCEIGDGVHIGPGSRLGGHCRVGRSAWVGIGATITNHKSVGEGSFVAAGAVVVDDVPDNVVVMGVPARIVRRLDDLDH